jgi:hypothetical protein
MFWVSYPDLEFLELGMPGESATNQHFEPFPVAFCSGYRMETYHATASLDVSSENEPLGIRSEDIIVGAGENNKGIFFDLLFCEDGGIVANSNIELFLYSKFFQCFHGRWDVVMHIAGSVFGIDQHIGILQCL